MNNWRYKLFQFMQGRYGIDDFGRFLLIASMVVLLLSNFRIFRILYLVALLLLAYTWFRIMSKNILKRQQENQRYWTYRTKFTNRRKGTAANGQKQDLGYDYYRCRSCGQTVRVPKGKGTIKITCPKCGNSFVSHS